ncbi:MAG: DUF11 domain-containing protein, partial [Planctomycetales bacterium]|nr:DUF11 domain-containing protein [Planctomycetales bacterium]
PSDAPGARFSDSIPTILTNVTYTREANGVTTDGTGNTINDVLNIGAGEQVTYTVTGSLAPSAAGQLTNMATITPPTNVLDPQPFNNSDIDTDNISRETIDLSIVKRSGLVEAIPGRPIRYQIVVSNIGNTDVSGAVVRDLFPNELTNVTWQSLATDGASGNSPSGSGVIEETVNLQVGSSIIYTVVGTIDSSATNLLNNIATVTAEGDTSPGNNTSIDTVFLVPTADLAITKTDGVDEVAIGDSLTYTIVATNHGPSDLTGVSVTDVLPDSLTNSTFTSVASGGASGNSASGTGNLNETLNLPVGSSVTYTVTATAGFNIRGMLTNTAVIQAPAGAVEIDPDNNVAIDTDRLKDVVRLGSEPTVIRRDSIVSETDSDVFQITAHQTGKLIINSLFDHDFGDLDIEVADSRGNVIAVANSTTDHENLVIPVVSQEQYFIRVFGKDGATNIYNLEVENFPTPRPAIVRLDAPSDSGMMNDDAITNETNPRFLITTDLSGFTSMGIPFLQPAAGESSLPNQAGVAIEVQLVNTDTGEVVRGFARQLGQNNSLYEFTAADPDATLDGNYLIQAFVRVFDGRQNADGADPASGRGPLSDPSWFIVDTIAPTAADRPDLVTSSDSGMSNEDNVTHINQPALTGVGEPGVKVRIFANRDGVGLAELIGQGVSNSDGLWEITVEPLADGKHHVRAIYEDMAGNISTLGEPLVLTIDTTPPNTPYLDLVRSSDTGMGDTDNITNDSTPTFTMTTHDTENGVDFDYKFRVYLRADAESEGVTAQEVLLYDSAVDPLIPVAELLDGLTNNELLTRTFGELPDGTHNLKLEVEDRAGNISEDFLLTITIDTQAPPAELDLIDSSDSGMLNNDNVTKNPAPTFSGVSELNSMVTLFANGVPVGTGMVGSDESNGVLGDGLGAWHVTTQNLVDGQYDVVAQITDKAGNSTTSAAETIWV